ncbi:C-C motif chemokine 20-like isoform X2 [Pleurodeles waltl]|uniref:C-C motif chemokine 20-like isoform X2 n=1 Tax=Pleurodeles waltl TaxID=8319 RepID=UPI0037095B6B
MSPLQSMSELCLPSAFGRPCESPARTMTALNSRRLVLASCIVLGLLQLNCGGSAAQGDLDCCTSYSKKPLRLKVVSNFTIQSSSDVCDMDAVIFHTKKRFNVCANPEEPWVKGIVKALSKGNKKSKGKRGPGKSRKTNPRKQG